MRELLSLAIPTTATALSPVVLAGVIAVALVVVFTPLWQRARLGVTLVHELGHALVGICCGRRFTGFVIRGDMSGHAVTSGPTRGFGRIATTWAGYPMPAMVGAALIWTALRGWAAPALTITLVALALTLIMVRSFTTAAVMMVAIALVAGLWWFRSDAVQQHVLIGIGLVLIVGAWRHLMAVIRGGGATDDPAMLARLTRVPRMFWLGTFVASCAAATWVTAAQLTPWL